MPVILFVGYVGILLLLVSWNWLLALVFLAVPLIAAKRCMPQMKGYIGERRVQKILLRLGKEYTVFHNVYVTKNDGKKTQIDHVVISKYGIFVVETKNYSGWIFGSEEQKNWTQTFYKNQYSFYNPILQNRTHVRALQRLFNRETAIHSIIVFSDAVTFKFAEEFTTAQVIQNAQLRKAMTNYKRVLFSETEVNAMKKALAKEVSGNVVKKWRVKRAHLKQFKERSKQMHEMSGICPQCGQQLIIKQGKYGDFYGCKGYPGCRYTVKVR